MGYYSQFPELIPQHRVGYPRVTHPCAAVLAPEGVFSLDLHVLGTPPAFVLSQDQTLQLKSSIPAASFKLASGS